MKFMLGTLVFLLSSFASAGTAMEVYRSPTCGCCTAWVEYMERNGFDITLHETDNMQPVKERADIPPGMGSCHTGFVEGYAIEGHVPVEDVKRLLKERPDARGLTVPGMPAGSPGMEMGGRQDPYEVLLYDKDGNTTVFNRYPKK